MKYNKVFTWLSTIAVLVSLTGFAQFSTSVASAQAPAGRTLCDDNGILCTEIADTHNYEGQYTGHDEPSLLFYSDKSGSGNSNIYRLTLPKDPPPPPQQDCTRGTIKIQRKPALWV